MFVKSKFYRKLFAIPAILLLTSFNVNNNIDLAEMNSKFNPQLGDIKLLEPRFTSGISVEEALLNRRSIREFTNEALTLFEVSQIFWSAYGITKEHSYPSFLRG
ncbi:MAG: hypothetical protein K8R37_04695, partial [Bacteroidales bacterium]|nr:hypothetical protein [Bacteroidales bacterium]